VRDLVAAVEAIQSNKTFFTSRVADMVVRGYLGRHQIPADGDLTLPNLTRREHEIIQLLAEGNSTKEIASQLDLSVKTVETHRSNLMRKLNLHSISELVLYAVRNNIVQVMPSPGTTYIQKSS
jgi:DNA-binding NarL/FixJ family response regulator